MAKSEETLGKEKAEEEALPEASAGEKKLGREKAEEQLPGPAEDGSQEPPSDAELVKADAKLPVYSEEARILESHQLRGNFTSVVPDTPSGYAVKKVGNLDGEDVDHSKPGATEAARAHGEAYQAEKRKQRWGY